MNHPKLTRPQVFKATVLVGGDSKAAPQARLMSVFAYARDHAEAERMAEQASGGMARGVLIEPSEMPDSVERRVLHGVTFYLERRAPR